MSFRIATTVDEALQARKDAMDQKLGQLQDALLRNARYICGIEMHTGKKTFDQCVEFFEKEGYQTHEVSMRETMRGTSDPTYLYYTLGKLQILKLRKDYKAKRGEGFSLAEFHDSFMKQGFPPIKIVRKAMLGDIATLVGGEAVFEELGVTLDHPPIRRRFVERVVEVEVALPETLQHAGLGLYGSGQSHGTAIGRVRHRSHILTK